MEWVEVQGKTVDIAVDVALRELEVKSRDDASVEIIQEPKAGFLGVGGRDAIVKVSRAPKKRRRRRSRSQSSGSRSGSGNAGNSSGNRQGSQKRSSQNSNQKAEPEASTEVAEEAAEEAP